VGLDTMLGLGAVEDDGLVATGVDFGAVTISIGEVDGSLSGTVSAGGL